MNWCKLTPNNHWRSWFWKCAWNLNLPFDYLNAEDSKQLSDVRWIQSFDSIWRYFPPRVSKLQNVATRVFICGRFNWICCNYPLRYIVEITKKQNPNFCQQYCSISLSIKTCCLQREASGLIWRTEMKWTFECWLVAFWCTLVWINGKQNLENCVKVY